MGGGSGCSGASELALTAEVLGGADVEIVEEDDEDEEEDAASLTILSEAEKKHMRRWPTDECRAMTCEKRERRRAETQPALKKRSRHVPCAERRNRARETRERCGGSRRKQSFVECG
jgi:hypothetical protein